MVKRKKMSPILNATLWVEQITDYGEDVGEYLNIQLLNKKSFRFRLNSKDEYAVAFVENLTEALKK
jgi:hypothetical protein